MLNKYVNDLQTIGAPRPTKLAFFLRYLKQVFLSSSQVAVVEAEMVQIVAQLPLIHDSDTQKS